MNTNIAMYRLPRKLSAAILFLLGGGYPIWLLAAQQPHDVNRTGSTVEPASYVHLTLPVAVQMALQHNRHLLLARDNVRDSMEQRRIAESHFFPIIKNDSAVLHLTELEGVTIPAGAIADGAATGLLPSHSLTIGQGADTSYTSGTELAQPLTQTFKLRAGVKAANADLRTAKIQSTDADNAIDLLVHQLYYSFLTEKMRGSAARDAVEAATIAEQENTRGVEDGKLLSDVKLASRADLLDKQQALLVSRLNIDDITLRIDDAVGLPLGTKVDLDLHGDDVPSVLPTREDAIALALNSNPGVLEAQQNVEKAKAGISASRDAYIPDVTGLARYSYQSGLPFFTHNFGTFGAAVSYNLFDGGKREADLRDAHIKFVMAETQLQQAESDVRIELSAAYDKVEELEELLEVATEVTTAREESLRIQIQRAEATAALPSGVSTARAGLSTARLNVLNTRLNLYLAQNNIKKLLGELPN